MNQVPAIKELRKFGLIVGGVFLIIGLWPLLFRGEDLRFWSLGLGGALAALGVLAPMSLKHVHQVWMKVGHILGSINTRIILGIIYYGLITPMGIVMRLMRKDPMHRLLMQEANTYRVVRPPRPRHHMRNQF